jgi:glycosyltransferase involved in cell wall biosynthesis
MKVLQVNEHYAPVGGAEHYIVDVSTHLEQRGVAVSVLYAVQTAQDFHVSGRKEMALPELQKRVGVSQSGRFQRIRRAIDELDPDVIQVHNLDEPDVLAWLTGLRPTVQFVHAHSAKFCPGDGKFYRRTQAVCQRPFGPYCLIAPYLHRCGSLRPWRITSNYATVQHWLETAPTLFKLMVASQYMKQELVRAGMPADHIVVNPIGVHVQPETALDSPKQEAVVLFVGRMYEVKGPQYLLAALDQLDIRCRAVFVGDGPDLERLKQAATKLASRHAVEFTGWVGHHEVNHLYQQARVVVVPSLWPEPFGMVGIEAFQHSTPVVAFDVGGVSEWLKDGENGWLVAPKDTVGLASAIKRILIDRKLAEEMGQRARQMTLERFNMERHVDSLLHVYQQALDVSPQRRREPRATQPVPATSAPRQ